MTLPVAPWNPQFFHVQSGDSRTGRFPNAVKASQFRPSDDVFVDLGFAHGQRVGRG